MRCPPENQRIDIYPVDSIGATAESRHSFGRNAQTGLDGSAKLASRVTPIISNRV
jgi:hypothetical protein